MDEQLTLFRAPRTQGDNRLLFLAFVPDEPSARTIYRHAGELRERYRLPGAVRPRDHLHISLQDLGGWSERTIRAAERVCVAAAARITPFEVALDRVVHWPTSRALVVTESDEARNLPLRKFRGSLNVEMAREFGPKIIKSSFTPHVTMLYSNRTIATKSIEPVCWTAAGIHLICSHHGDTKYDWLGYWPLVG